MNYYDAEYFERGLETGKSAYQNYMWLPELTIPMAMSLVDYLHIAPKDTILDYGCAKGYLVKALRLLNRKAFGVDISTYAINNVDEKVKQYCEVISNENPFKVSMNIPNFFDWCIAKDVLEHIPKEVLFDVLKALRSDKLFICVPLGENKKYRSVVNDYDKSHIVCENEYWWGDLLKSTDWNVEEFTFQINGIKENHYKSSPNGHGFFICERRR